MNGPAPLLSHRMRLLLALALLPLFTGCVAVAVGGAAAGGAMMANDRRTVGTISDDQEIELRAGSRIGNKYGDKVHVTVTSFNRMALITGEVPDEAAKADVENIVRGVTNVRSVVNELVVGPIDPGYWSTDAIITSKVKARFVDANKFNALHVKVITQNRTVFLMGLVTRKEADDATEIARTTSDVRKVVRVFEYIQPPPPAEKPVPLGEATPAK